MAITKRGNSKYWYIQFQFEGQTYIKSSRSTNKKAAEQMERELRTKVHAKRYLGQKDRITMHQAYADYKRSKASLASYPNLVAQGSILNRMLPMSSYIDELTTSDLEQFKWKRMEEGAGAEIIKYGLSLIRGMWKLAKKRGFEVSDLEFPQIKIPRSSLRYLSATEEQRLLSELDPQRQGNGLPPLIQRNSELVRAMQDAYDLVILLIDTGARYSEIANIEWQRIDLEERSIRLWRSKVENETTLFMTERVFEVLLRRSKSGMGGFVFTNQVGEARGYCTQSIRKAMNRAGLSDCTVHTLRHTLASRLVQNGMSIYEVKDILGHGDIKTTMRYAHLERYQTTTKARDVINRFNSRNIEG